MKDLSGAKARDVNDCLEICLFASSPVKRVTKDLFKSMEILQFARTPFQHATGFFKNWTSKGKLQTLKYMVKSTLKR